MVAALGGGAGPALPPIDPERLRGILLRMSPRKSRGADGWGPHELGSLPLPYHERLRELRLASEAEGRWREEFGQILVTLIPKPGALTGAQLRPIGILPYM